MRLFYDYAQRAFYGSFAGSTFSFPSLFRNDQEPLEIFLVEPSGSGGLDGLPLLEIDPTGYTFRAAISQGDPGSAEYTQLCYTADFAPFRPPATLTQVQSGTPTRNAIWRIKLPAEAYGGAFTIRNNAGVTTVPIAKDATGAVIQAALETVFGAGNISVSRSGSIITIEFIGALSHTAVLAPTIDDSGLTIPTGLKGVLTLSTVELAAAFDAADTKTLALRLEIEFTDPDGNRRTYAQNITVSSDAITDAPELSEIAEFYTKAEADGRYLALTQNLADLPAVATARTNLGLDPHCIVKSNLGAVSNPAVGDDSADGYAPGSCWINTTTDAIFICADAALGAAVWREIPTGAAPLASPAFTGVPTGPTAADGTNTTQLATTAFVQNAKPGFLANAALTGTPTAPTAAAGTNTTQVATTAFVQAVKNALLNGAGAAYDTLKELQDLLVADESTSAALAATVASKAPLASPALTGTPTAPTATAGDNTTKVATTAFVAAAVAAGGGGSSITANNVLRVNKGGNDGTAVAGDWSKPYLTIQAAITAAAAGQIVCVQPGTYNEAITLKNGVYVYCQPGVKITLSSNTNSAVVALPSTNGESYYLLGYAEITQSSTFAGCTQPAIDIQQNNTVYVIEANLIRSTLTTATGAIATTYSNAATAPSTILVRQYIRSAGTGTTCGLAGSTDKRGMVSITCPKIYNDTTTGGTLIYATNWTYWQVNHCAEDTANSKFQQLISGAPGNATAANGVMTGYIGRIDCSGILSGAGTARINLTSDEIVDQGNSFTNTGVNTEVVWACKRWNTARFAFNVVNSITLIDCDLTSTRTDVAAFDMSAATAVVRLKNCKITCAATGSSRGIIEVSTAPTGIGLQVLGTLILVGSGTSNYGIKCSSAMTLYPLGAIFSNKDKDANTTIGLGSFTFDATNVR